MDDASLQVVHVIAKRRLIDPLLAEARSMGVPISAVDVVSADGARMGFNLLSRGETAPSLAGRLSGAITTAAASEPSFFITMKTLRPTASWSAGALSKATTVAVVGMVIVCSPPL